MQSNETTGKNESEIGLPYWAGSIVSHQQGPSPEPYKIKIERGQKGSYGWEISIAGADPSVIIEKLKAIDQQLKITFAPL